jgi:hypothetical protein
MRKIIWTAVAALIILPLPSFGEIYECNGKWTNQPCDGAVGKSLQEITAPSKPQTQDEGSKVPTLVRQSNGRCGDNEYFITTRPEPKMRWTAEPIRMNQNEQRLRFSAVIIGNGNVQVEFVANGEQQGFPVRKVLGTQDVKLPEAGGEKKFDRELSIKTGWTWRATATNHGRFSGYCSSISEERVLDKRKLEETTEVADEALATARDARNHNP